MLIYLIIPEHSWRYHFRRPKTVYVYFSQDILPAIPKRPRPEREEKKKEQKIAVQLLLSCAYHWMSFSIEDVFIEAY